MEQGPAEWGQAQGKGLAKARAAEWEEWEARLRLDRAAAVFVRIVVKRLHISKANRAINEHVPSAVQ